ncbi:FxSxx-COOH cyclophane-containing RiPP peptide [Streptomyces sp. NPDC054842]
MLARTSEPECVSVLAGTLESEFPSVLVDVSDLSLEELGGLPDTVLRHVLQDVRRPPAERFAAFASALL